MHEPFGGEAGKLTPQKARILLALMLLTTNDIGQIQAAFQRY